MNMESYVNCPSCGEQVYVCLKPYDNPVSKIMKQFDQINGIDKTDHFQGDSKCKCGKRICTTIHVTAGI